MERSARKFVELWNKNKMLSLLLVMVLFLPELIFAISIISYSLVLLNPEFVTFNR